MYNNHPVYIIFVKKKDCTGTQRFIIVITVRVVDALMVLYDNIIFVRPNGPCNNYYTDTHTQYFLYNTLVVLRRQKKKNNKKFPHYRFRRRRRPFRLPRTHL